MSRKLFCYLGIFRLYDDYMKTHRNDPDLLNAITCCNAFDDVSIPDDLKARFENLAKDMGRRIEPTFTERFCNDVRDDKLQNEEGVGRGCEEGSEGRGVSTKQHIWNTGTD